jgi:hypothetical protein
LYRKFTVEEMLHFGRAMNDHFDDHYARRLITESDIPLTARTGSLSRWWATKTAVAGAPIALAMLALGFVNTWAMQPMAAFVARPMITPGFETRGITPFAYFVLAFAIAVTVGILVRNTAAAIGATIAHYIAGLLVLGFRPTYLAPVDLVEAYPPADTIAEPWTPALSTQG